MFICLIGIMILVGTIMMTRQQWKGVEEDMTKLNNNISNLIRENERGRNLIEQETEDALYDKLGEMRDMFKEGD